MEFRPMSVQEIRGWYAREFLRTFPPNEQKPLVLMLDLAACGQYTAMGLYDGAALLGYATLQTHPDHPGYVLLDYLGVTAARRNGGLGARILTLLEERFRGRARVIVEAESPVPGEAGPENELRSRRIGFYERCGCQKVYEMGACGIRCQAMTLGEPGKLEPLMAAHRAIYGSRPDITIPLGPGEIPAPAHWGKP